MLSYPCSTMPHSVFLAPRTQHIPLSTNTAPHASLRGPLHGAPRVAPTALLEVLSPQQGLEESEQVIGGQVIVGSEPTLQFLSLSPVYETDSPGPHLGSVGITLSLGWGLIGHYCTLSRKPSWDLSPALPGLPPGCCS